MFERALDRVSGRLDQAIHARAAVRLRELIRELIAEALSRWSDNGWHTFDDTEINCSAQLFRWLEEARRANSRFSLLAVNLESIVLTHDMLLGDESVKFAARPDLRISVRAGGVSFEAKRLTDTADLCRAYVHNGMARFVSSTYGAREQWGVMIGYVQESTTVNLRRRVNDYVDAHRLMGIDHRLSMGVVRPDSQWQTSMHARDGDVNIELEHVWVMLP